MLSSVIWVPLLAQLASPWNDSPMTQRGLRDLPSQNGAGIEVLRDSLDKPGPQFTPYDTEVLPDGSIRFHDHALTYDKLGVAFDITDYIERLHGRSPYRMEQRGIADATREARIQKALTFRRQTTYQALASLPSVLAAVWNESRLDPAARRRLIFQLWDECAEQGPADVLEASAQARTTITEFIRHQLPAGSPYGYTAAELQSLNAKRTSTARFVPY